MKKLSGIFTLMFFALVLTDASGQVFEITPTYGYQLGGRLNYGSNYLKVDDSGMFGITAGFEARRDYMVEITYYNMSSDLLMGFWDEEYKLGVPGLASLHD